MKFWFWQTILCLQFGLFWGQNPCEPNPCGINTRCLTQPGRSGSPVISCKCLAGFRQGDPFEGCSAVSNTALNGDESTFPGADEGTDVLLVSAPAPTTTTTTTRRTTTTTRTTTRRTTTSTTTERPYVYPTRPSLIGFDEDGQQITLTAAEPDFPSFPSRSSNNFVASNSNSPSDLNLNDIPNSEAVQKIYDAECLANGDCPLAEYCDLPTETCKNACSLNVCGPKAECKGRLHRPLCYCPDGYEGNPHVKCMEKKSRVGLRFKRFALGV